MHLPAFRGVIGGALAFLVLVILGGELDRPALEKSRVRSLSWLLAAVRLVVVRW